MPLILWRNRRKRHCEAKAAKDAFLNKLKGMPVYYYSLPEDERDIALALQANKRVRFVVDEDAKTRIKLR